MNVLLITDSYPPEIRSAAELMHELAVELAMRGHNVTVVTSYPRYNLSDKARTQTFEQVVLEDTIRVIRVKNPPHHNVGKVRRGLAELLLRRVLWRTVRNLVLAPVDSVLVYSPPLPLAWVGAQAKRAYGARFVLNAQDLFPQNAIDLGILRSRLLIRFLPAWNGERTGRPTLLSYTHTATENSSRTKKPCRKTRSVSSTIGSMSTDSGRRRASTDLATGWMDGLSFCLRG